MHSVRVPMWQTQSVWPVRTAHISVLWTVNIVSHNPTQSSCVTKSKIPRNSWQSFTHKKYSTYSNAISSVQQWRFPHAKVVWYQRVEPVWSIEELCWCSSGLNQLHITIYTHRTVCTADKIHTPSLKKNCGGLFLSELCQIATNSDNFWQKDGKEAKIMQDALIFHIT